MTAVERATLVFALINAIARKRGYTMGETEKIAVFSKAYDFVRADKAVS